MNTRLLTIAAVLAAPAIGHSETLRCGTWVVDDQASLAELAQKCGEPVDKESKTEEIRRPNEHNSGTQAVGTTTTERWYYQRSPRALRMVVVIQDGKIKSIDKAD
jgi:hypothetical protein